ncbi:hypothetical protein RB195_003695 [Necator americanus]|uniref:Potassium channel domain-containing protein n=1 Tax=Necator americanus TaxID=51031 RepID=A0ABR1DPP7_NECAM
MGSEEEKGKNEETTQTRPSMLVPNNFEGIREDENEPDSGFHTIASKRELRDKGNNLAEAGRRFRKYRSYSLSETPSHKNSLIYGTAKNRALHSRKTSNEEQNKNRTISLPQHSAEQEKAVNNYYDRHPPSLSNQKNYDTINGFHDYPLKRTISVVDPKDSGKSPTMPTTRKFHNSVYWIVHNRRKYGFRHVCMLLLVLTYTLLGAAMFFNIESRYERETVSRRKIALDAKVEAIAEQILIFRNETIEIVNFSMLEKFVKKSYIALLEEESLFSGSTYYKTAEPDKYKWTYASAIFFSMNLYTTTGYGSIAADSKLGQICVICYSLLSIPITLVVIRDLGQWTLVYLTKIYAHVLVLFRRAMGYQEPHEDTMISLPIKFCLSLLAGYLLFAAIFIYLFDDWYGDQPNTGLPFFTAFYFSYISIATIGLGDIMPNNATFHPIISALFFFGMPIMKVVNRATYVFIENGVFGAFTLLESSIDQLTSRIQPKEEEPQETRTRTISRCSYCSHTMENPEEDKATELLNNLTIRSLATFARANADVYGGGFGRVNLRKGDLVHSKTNVDQT